MKNYPNSEILADAHTYLGVHIYATHGRKFTEAIR